jgi:hypothetical protein
MRAQYANRQQWMTCSECQGRSFSDPTKAYHYPSCSKYRGWRFGRYDERQQDLHAKALRSSVHWTCTCPKPGSPDYPALCSKCAEQADFDGGGE